MQEFQSRGSAACLVMFCLEFSTTVGVKIVATGALTPFYQQWHSKSLCARDQDFIRRLVLRLRTLQMKPPKHQHRH